MERIRVNIIPKGITPVCHASQYDTGRVIRFDIMDDLQPFMLSGTETIEFRVCKPDGNIVTAAVENTSSSYVDIVTTQQMTACEGINKCTLNIDDENDYNIATINIDMKVQVDVLKDGIESDTEIHNLTTQIQDINAEIVPQMVADEVASQYDSSNVIFDDHPTAGHGTGYVVKSENVPDELNKLNDVSIDTPSSNQALVWDADNNKWTNGEVSTVGSIDDLNDVDTSGKQAGDSLRYDGNEWVAKPTTIEMTQAEYNAIADFTPYANTHIVITDAPNLNPTASDIEYSSGVTVKSAIDTDKSNINTISGKLTTSNIDNFVVVKDLSFASGTTTEQCISNIVTTYGKKTICFGYVLTGVGWFSGMITFHSDTQGGGFLVAMGNGKLWAITYVNGTVTIFEK